jgi:protein arginine kinase activator
MLCQDCHKNLASVRYAEVVDGKVSEVHLCQECLGRRQESVSSGFQFAKPTPFAKKPAGPVRASAAVADPVEARQSCTSCSTTLKQILETGRVGCSTCYASFPAQLESLLEGIHVALAHRGKVPRLDDARARVRADLQSKRGLLKTALTTENYEEAAALRDEIRVLETGLSASEGGRD